MTIVDPFHRSDSINSSFIQLNFHKYMVSYRLKSSSDVRSLGWDTLCYLVLIIFMLFITGCAGKSNQLAPNELSISEMRLHTVRYPNENLSMIALWYTGNAKNWSTLKTYNGHLRSPGAISLGSTIRIPRDLMVRTDLMPPEFVIEQRSKYKLLKKKPASTVIPQPTKTAAPEAPHNPPEEEDPSDEEFSEALSQDQLIENLITK